MPSKAIKHQLTCPFEITSGSFLIGRRRILLIPRNHLDGFEITNSEKNVRLTCEYELYILPNKKVCVAKDHGSSSNLSRDLVVLSIFKSVSKGV